MVRRFRGIWGRLTTVALALALILTACSSTGAPGASGSNAPAQGNDLIVGFDGGSFQQFLDQAVTTPFVKETGAHVIYDLAPEQDRLAKAIVTKGTRYDDIQELDSKDIEKAIASGIADKLDKSIVTNWADIDPHFRNDYWASIITYYFGIVYNTEKIPEGITSWTDLLKPEYKGHVALPAFDWEGFEWLLIMNKIEGGSDTDFSKGIAKIKEYYATQDPVTMTGSDNGVQLFTSGEVWAAPFFDGRARQLQDAGVPVKFVFPSEGAVALGEGLGLMTFANKDLAQQYLNFALDPDNQIEFAKLSNYSPTNVKALAKLPADMQNLIVPQDALDNLMQIDHAAAYDHISEAQKAWNEQVTQ